MSPDARKRTPARTPAPAVGKAHRGRALALRDGGSVRLSRKPDGEALKVVAPDGEVRLEVLLTPSGAVLRVAGPHVAIEAGGGLTLRCGRFEVEAEAIALGASGDVTVRAGRGLGLRAGHDAEVSAQAVQVEGRRGEIALKANDDVVVNGERVLLNCPTDEEVERQRREAKTLQDVLALPFRSPGSPKRLSPGAPVPEEEP